MHITINANWTTCIVLALALGAHAIGYVSQIVKPAFAQTTVHSDTSPEVVACMFHNLERIQNVHSTSEPDASPFAWLRAVCTTNPDAR